MSHPETDATTTPSPREQLMRYANDLARLYSRVQLDAARLARAERRLEDLARVTLVVIDASSAEAAGARIADELGAVLGAERVAVFLSRPGRYRLLAHRGAAPARAAIGKDEAKDLGTAPGARDDGPWPEVLGGSSGPAWVVPFPGRGGKVMGLAVADRGPPPEVAGSLELLARFVGVLLEAHALDEARRDRGGSTAVGPMSRPEAAPAVLGESPPVKRLREQVARFGPTPSAVLVLGETGTGKELVARGIHDASRRKGPFVAMNCGAIPENLVESELFGHEPGAFTGASKRHRGKVEQAHGGTLFLDEVGDMPRPVQVKLLRFLQDGRYTPLGAEGDRLADVRIIAATNRDLPAAVAAGEFRQDLLFRLDVLSLRTPPLRDRQGDVTLLAARFVDEVALRLGRPAPRLSAGARAALEGYSWPGNVRELRNVIERAVVLCDGDEVGPDLLPGAPPAASIVPRPEPAPVPLAPLASSLAGPAEAPAAAAGPAPAPSELLAGLALPDGGFRAFGDAKTEVLERFEEAYCRALLDHCGGNLAQAARLAGMDRKNLTRKVKAYGLRRHDDEDDEVGG